MDIVEALRFLEKQVADPSQGLPEEVFCYISKMTPLVNVDLLIKDERGRTLLSWRNDPYAGKGWHVPGGIVRFRESLEARAKKVAEIEIGTILDFEKVPIAVNQFICPEQPVRSHFISFLYKCFLPGAFALNKQGISTGEAGYLQWHESCPEDLLACHGVYKKYMTQNDLFEGGLCRKNI